MNITGLNIPTGIPLVYELDDNLKPIKHYYLGNEEEIEKAINAVASQGEENSEQLSLIAITINCL